MTLNILVNSCTSSITIFLCEFYHLNNFVINIHNLLSESAHVNFGFPTKVLFAIITVFSTASLSLGKIKLNLMNP